MGPGRTGGIFAAHSHSSAGTYGSYSWLLGACSLSRTQSAANLTPESVVKAFRDAGFEINGVRDLDYYPGPMSPGLCGTRFFVETTDEIVHVFVVLYSSDEEAKRARSLSTS